MFTIFNDWPRHWPYNHQPSSKHTGKAMENPAYVSLMSCKKKNMDFHRISWSSKMWPAWSAVATRGVHGAPVANTRRTCRRWSSPTNGCPRSGWCWHMPTKAETLTGKGPGAGRCWKMLEDDGGWWKCWMRFLFLWRWLRQERNLSNDHWNRPSFDDFDRIPVSRGEPQGREKWTSLKPPVTQLPSPR